MIKIERDNSLLDDLKLKHIEYFENTKPKKRSPNKPSQTYLELLKAIPKWYSKDEKELLRFIGIYYKKFLIGSPYELELLRNILYRRFPESLFLKVSDPKTRIHKRLKAIFNYDSFIKRVPSKWGAYNLTMQLQVNVCPYCNRQYITTYHSNNGKTRPSLDHFYDKVTYPYFAISLFNLVPSCSVCNSSFKGKKKFTVSTHINPYVEDFNDTLNFSAGFGFSWGKSGKEVDIDAFLGAGNNFTIKLIEAPKVSGDKLGILKKKAKRGLSNAETFKLEAIYGNHKDQVYDLIKTAYYYNENRLEDIKKSTGDLFESREEVLSWVLGLDSSLIDFEKRSLSKFIYDIANELGITRYIDKKT